MTGVLSRAFSLTLAAVLALSIATACSSRQGTSPVPAGTKSVAVFGDTPEQLHSQIESAQAQGQNPAYVTVSGQSKTYEFSVYARFVRSAHTLFVIAYARLYAFPIASLTMHLRGQQVDISTIPQVATPVLDQWIGTRGPGEFKVGDQPRKHALCPDCALLVFNRANIQTVAARWQSLQDPWQINPTYIAWTPPQDGTGALAPLNGIRPLLTGHGGAPSCGGGVAATPSNGFWYCPGDGYVPGGNSNPWGYGPYPGGGGVGGVNPTPSPVPIPSASPGCKNGTTVAQNITNTAEKQMHDNLTAAINQNQEWAGFTYRDSSGNLVSVGAFYNTDANGNAIGFPSSPPAYDGWTPVAWFHDHNIDYSQQDPSSGIQGPGQVSPGSPYSGNIFSADDESYSNRNGIDGYIGEKNDTGNQWAQWTHGGTVGQQTNYTNKNGLASGC